MAKLHRNTIAALLLLALLVFGAPSLGFAGGCDEPGYTGGSCNKAENQGSSGDNGDDGLGEEPADSSTGGSTGQQILPSRGTESTSESGWSFISELGRTVLSWLTVASLP